MRSLSQIYKEEPERLGEFFCYGRFYLCIGVKKYCTLLRMRVSKPRKNKKPDILYVKESSGIFLGDIIYIAHDVSPAAVKCNGANPAPRIHEIEGVGNIFSKDEYYTLSEKEKHKKIKKFIKRGGKI